MKLFKFYPRRYSRMYVLAEHRQSLMDRSDELFAEFMRREYSLEAHEALTDVLMSEELKDYRKEFDAGLEKAEVGTVFVDNHY